MRKIMLTYTIIFFAFTQVCAQDKVLSNAEKSYDERDYTSAIRLYKKALRNTADFTNQQQIAHSIAMAYYQMNDYRNSADWFADAMGDHTNDIQTYFYYSQVLAANKEYNDALSILKRAQEHNPDNKEVGRRISAIELILINKEEDSTNVISKVPKINSDYSDYGIGKWSEGIVFSSMRKNKSNQRVDGRTGQGYSNLYYAKQNSNYSWSEPVIMAGKINSANNDGAFTFDAVNSIAYWTTCTEKPNNCLIYSSEYSSETGKWIKPKKVSFMNIGFNYGHPYISDDGITLYFTSNMTGGYGKNDIWKATRKTDGMWGIPINLGDKINTSRNEMFPSVYGDSLLFFSTDGISSYGGLDIYFSVVSGIDYTKPHNVGLPVNSAADDFSIIINENGKGGFFCSNRDLKTSDDIYEFDGFPVKIVMQGKVFHELDMTPLANTTIIYTNSNDHSDTIITQEDGSFKLILDAYDKYRVSAINSSYFTDNKVVNTFSNDLIFSQIPQIEENFYLTKKSYPCGIVGVVTNKETTVPMSGVIVSISDENNFSNYVKTDELGNYSFEGLKPNTIYTVKIGGTGYFSESRVCTLPKVDREMNFSRSNGYDMDFQLLMIQTKKEVTLSNIYYDYNKATLRETSKIELDKLASMIRETPKIVIQINAHTDERGKSGYNMKLSADRANSVVNYLVYKGVGRSRLIAKGYGESMLLIKNANTEDEHQANRRTTFRVMDDNVAENIYEAAVVEHEDIKRVDGLVYRIQLLTTGRKRDINIDFSEIQRSISDVVIYEFAVGAVWKYEAGDRETFVEAKKLRNKLRSSGYKDCFVISYFNGSKIPVSQANDIEGGSN